ncbi:Choline-phosphate cytidylyltransferase B [Astathelohania contejeani]|uniref:choline-phosphate cytidylyltransferase n=1 Tax=Astathelohania contejeani TaxID=164912 RepID=A0ABQ7HXU8_9MICR|nr:Choline-phosphate cytidylyltransferase B [Thelohania contejeani]
MEAEFEWVEPNYIDSETFKYSEIPTIRKYKVPKNRPVRIYCDGIYDLFHYGHARSLKQAKYLFDNVILVVGIPEDSETVSRKGKVVMTAEERIESLQHCRYVDEIIAGAPWVITPEFIELHSIDYVAHDDAPYLAVDENGKVIGDIYAFLKDNNRFIPVRRTEGISTTGLITRIVREYEEHVRRNLARGVSSSDLNLGFVMETRLRLEKELDEFKRGVKVELSVAMDYWEKRSQELLASFLEKFNKKNNNKIIKGMLKMFEKRNKNVQKK